MKKLVMLLVLVTFTFLGIGCAKCYWTKEGFNSSDWNRDQLECNYSTKAWCSNYGSHVTPGSIQGGGGYMGGG